MSALVVAVIVAASGGPGAGVMSALVVAVIVAARPADPEPAS